MWQLLSSPVAEARRRPASLAPTANPQAVGLSNPVGHAKLPVPTPTRLTQDQAAARYKSLAEAYALSRRDLDKALDADNPSLKAIRAGAKKATEGYRVRITGLINTTWPEDVQPYIDKYVDLSGYGLDTLNAAAHAKTMSDLLDSGDEADIRKLTRRRRSSEPRLNSLRRLVADQGDTLHTGR